MRSFFGSILLILVLAALGATIYYHWSTNSHLNSNSATPTNRKTIQVINMEKRAAALQAVPAEQTPVFPAEEIPASPAGMPEPAEL
ncbi:MAG: hypothetical protein ACLRPT_07625 [Akkermansia muciniphila]